MSAADLLAVVHSQGAELRVDGENLVITRAAGPLPDGLLAELRAHKSEILEALRAKEARTATITIRCRDCRKLRMAEVRTSEGPRFVWGCAKGHIEHGYTTPELHRLIAPESCLAAGDFSLVASASKQ